MQFQNFVQNQSLTKFFYRATKYGDSRWAINIIISGIECKHCDNANQFIIKHCGSISSFCVAFYKLIFLNQS